MVRLITSVLLSLIRPHTTFDDLDVIGHGDVRKVKLHSHFFFFFLVSSYSIAFKFCMILHSLTDHGRLLFVSLTCIKAG